MNTRLYWSLIAGGFAAFQLFRPQYNWNGRRVLITGGSRGLGLRLARDLVKRGASVAICARKREELDDALEQLRPHGRAVAYRADVREREQVEEVVDRVQAAFGGIDVLVNNAGVIEVGPIDSMEVEDFEQAMRVMFWGPLYATLAVLPRMRARREGSIVNITSVGGKIAVPRLIPYCCAKFAAVALSEGLAAELRPSGVHCLTVVPGLMRTGSHLGAEFKGNAAAEYAWFSLGATVPGAAMSAGRASRQIIEAIERRADEVILSVPAQVGARVHGAFPELVVPVLGYVHEHVLPAANANRRTITGRQAERELDSTLQQVATGLGRRAARKLNQQLV
ncbi:MAG: SDR family oxidoreductase [Bryobacterales bacterium]|nr:SDR family oxidoreductase [Bryobacterales bacterium]